MKEILTLDIKERLEKDYKEQLIANIKDANNFIRLSEDALIAISKLDKVATRMFGKHDSLRLSHMLLMLSQGGNVIPHEGIQCNLFDVQEKGQHLVVMVNFVYSLLHLLHSYKELSENPFD